MQATSSRSAPRARAAPRMRRVAVMTIALSAAIYSMFVLWGLRPCHWGEGLLSAVHRTSGDPSRRAARCWWCQRTSGPMTCSLTLFDTECAPRTTNLSAQSPRPPHGAAVSGAHVPLHRAAMRLGHARLRSQPPACCCLTSDAARRPQKAGSLPRCQSARLAVVTCCQRPPPRYRAAAASPTASRLLAGGALQLAGSQAQTDGRAAAVRLARACWMRVRACGSRPADKRAPACRNVPLPHPLPHIGI